MGDDRFTNHGCRSSWLIGAALCSVAGWTGSAVAQTADAAAAQAETASRDDDRAAPDEIVVTAQKFAEPLSKAPITASAIGAEGLAARGLASIQDFNSVVPGMVINVYAGRPIANIRGVGQPAVPGPNYAQIAFNIDGVYIGSTFANSSSFLDLERIEVLRGPQGTLYGRNATGGAVNLITAKPTRDFYASADLTVGNYGTIGTAAVISGPLTEAISARIAFGSQHHRGYSLNLADGKYYDDEDGQAVRGTMLFELSPAAKLTLSADYYERRDGSAASHFFGFGSTGRVLPGMTLGGLTIPLDANGKAIDPRLLNINSIPNLRMRNFGFAADMEWQLNDDITFRSISSYRKVRTTYVWDFDFTTAAVPAFSNPNTISQGSQELQLLGQSDSLKWVTGLYYYERSVNSNTANVPVNFGTPTAPNYFPLTTIGIQGTKAYAAFGQATLELTDRLSATAGVRYSHERATGSNQTLVPLFPPSIDPGKEVSFDDWSPKFTLSYQATSKLLVYGTISKGFLAGGFNVNQRPPLTAFGPETLWNYEAGIKYRQRGFSIDLAGFHYNYRGLQVSKIVNSLPATVNAATSRVNGVELESTIRPFDGLQVTATASYVDSKYREYENTDPITGLNVDLSGNQLAGSAKYQANIYATYTIPVGDNNVSISGEWNRRSRIFFTEYQSNDVSQPAVSAINAAVRFGSANGAWYVEAFGKNLTDETVAVSKFINGSNEAFSIAGQLSAPRTFGLRLHYQFGR